MLRAIVLAVIAFGALGDPSIAAMARPLPVESPVAIERISVRSEAIARNLQGNDPLRQVAVLLPPGYHQSGGRRYPVIYFLPGFDSTVDDYVREAAMAPALAASHARSTAPAIVVVPDGATRYGGSFYTDSPVTGDYERFVSRELVAEIDRRYRTIARRQARGISGHSMGGYGALRLAMRHPDVFASVFSLSTCCAKPYEPNIDRVKALTKAGATPPSALDRHQRMILASASAWSPVPGLAPFQAELGLRGDGFDQAVLMRWSESSLSGMMPQYVPALRAMRAIAIEVGDKDGLAPHSRLLHERLEHFGIAHRWAQFEGDHGNRLAERFENALLPFFAEYLAQR